jgi:Leucine-rich repeat (LRR) protein
LSIGSGSIITELPEDIGDLHYLQTLDIRDSRIKKLTPAIGRLQKLVRLLLDDLVELSSEAGNLEALQELSFGAVCSIKVVEALRRLVKLKLLGINLYGRKKVWW